MYTYRYVQTVFVTTSFLFPKITSKTNTHRKEILSFVFVTFPLFPFCVCLPISLSFFLHAFYMCRTLHCFYQTEKKHEAEKQTNHKQHFIYLIPLLKDEKKEEELYTYIYIYHRFGYI